jgi:ribosomal protein L11 methyltransferase
VPWLQLHLTAPPEQVPGLEAVFEALGALSVTCGDAENAPVLEPAPGETPLWGHTRVTALFDGDADAGALESSLAAAVEPTLLRTLSRETLQDQAWERAWLADFHPMRFGRRLWVCPAGERPEVEDAVVLDLDPGLAFGTGTHPTTALCLRWLDAADLDGRRVLDFGCGSGILAIAAARLGAAAVTALDHDPQALEATRDNARKNGVTERIGILPPGTSPRGRFDVILANILAGTLVELAPRLTDLAAPGGGILLSGILAEQAETVAAAYAGGFELAPPQTDGGWVLLHGRRRGN